MTLREFRKVLHRTQAQVAKTLGMSQDSVSRLEQRSDVLLSTLRCYLEALGGELEISVKLPNHGKVVLSGFSEMRTIRKGRNSKQEAALAS